uniref:Uncharacterized protein n=1 Tax=Leersia perrieri TaxID=77586 RepID=A0A0D9XS08_9ORYZ
MVSAVVSPSPSQTMSPFPLPNPRRRLAVPNPTPASSILKLPPPPHRLDHPDADRAASILPRLVYLEYYSTRRRCGFINATQSSPLTHQILRRAHPGTWSSPCQLICSEAGVAHGKQYYGNTVRV